MGRQLEQEALSLASLPIADAHQVPDVMMLLQEKSLLCPHTGKQEGQAARKHTLQRARDQRTNSSVKRPS